MREDIAFRSEGLHCRGWLYTPEGQRPGERAPAIVMAHGFSAVKEMYLGNFAERFAAAGFVTLVFDYRFLGASEGEPRGQVVPLEQENDYRNAITWLCARPEVDPDRIGVWGTSFSGGLVIYLGAYDKRVKAVVAQVPAAVNWETRRKADPRRMEALRRMMLADRAARCLTGAGGDIPVVAPPGEECYLRPPDAWEWFTRAGRGAPNWVNRVTLASLERALEFDAAGVIHLVAPTPLLMIVAAHDSLLPAVALRQAFERAGEPKAWRLLPCGHFDLYDRQPWLDQASGAAIEWFSAHL